MTQCEICGTRTGFHGFSFENHTDEEESEREFNGAWLSLSELGGEWVEDDS